MDTNELSVEDTAPPTVTEAVSVSEAPTSNEALAAGLDDKIDPALMQAVIDDFVAGWRMDERGELEKYYKQHVAILDGKVIGSDKDYGKLVDRMLQDWKFSPERLVVIFVGDEAI